MSEEKKYIHPISLEVPMDFWLGVEKLLVEYKIKTGEKITKKDFVLKLIEEGHSATNKELNEINKADSKPDNTTSNDEDWQEDAS